MSKSLSQIHEGLERDEDSGSYTFFDYMLRASRLPADMLVAHTDIESIALRREQARYMDFPETRGRIWKKVRTVNE